MHASWSSSPVAIGHAVVPYQRKREANRGSEPSRPWPPLPAPAMTQCVDLPGPGTTPCVFPGTLHRISPVAQRLWTVRVWTKAFRGTAFSEAHMCPCTVLAAASQGLPGQVAKEVKGFFKMCQEKLVTEGLSPSNAAEVLSTITGALVLANAFGDTAEYDRATRDLLRHRTAAPADRHGTRGPRTKRFAKRS